MHRRGAVEPMTGATEPTIMAERLIAVDPATEVAMLVPSPTSVEVSVVS